MTTNTLPAIVQGDDYPLQFTFTQGGAAVNVTGWKVRVMVKANLSDADAAAVYDNTVTAAAGPDATAGIIRCPIAAAATKLLPVGIVNVQARRELSGTFRTLLMFPHRVLDAVINA